jgi:hypothetical protein
LVPCTSEGISSEDETDRSRLRSNPSHEAKQWWFDRLIIRGVDCARLIASFFPRAQQCSICGRGAKRGGRRLGPRAKCAGH